MRLLSCPALVKVAPNKQTASLIVKTLEPGSPPVIGNVWSMLQPSFKKHRKRAAWLVREGKKQKRKVSYGELEKAALTIAALLRSEGVGEGDVVGVTAPNGPECAAATLAGWKLGARVAPIHIGNSDAEIQAQVNAIQPKAMLGFNTIQLTDNQHLISLKADEAAVKAERDIEVPENPEAIALLLYTSGSTGKAKVVKLTHQNVGSNALAAVNELSANASDRFISLLPLSHAMGILGTVTFPLYVGARLVAPRMIAANEILATISEERISIVVAVPRLFRNIMLGLDRKFDEAGAGLRAYRKLLEKLPLSLRVKANALTIWALVS